MIRRSLLTSLLKAGVLMGGTGAFGSTGAGSGFPDAFAGNQGEMLLAALKSPNFVHNVSGWTIRRDGSAEFNNIIIRGGVVIGGTSLYYSGTPAAGNLVASIAASGGTDSFGNAYLAGVTAYNPVIFTAIQINNGALGFYSAASQAGPYSLLGNIQEGLWSDTGSINLQPDSTLALSLTSLLCTFNTPVDISVGVTGSGGGLVIENTNTPTAPTVQAVCNASTDPAIGTQVIGDTKFRWYMDANGHAHLSNGTTQDTNAWNIGRRTLVKTGDQTISSVTATGITYGGVTTTPVQPYTYRIRGKIRGTQGPTSIAQVLGLTGPAVSAGLLMCTNYTLGLGSTVSEGEFTGAGTINTPAFPISNDFIIDFDGWFTYTAAGNVGLTGAEGAAGDTWIVRKGSFFEMMPVI